MTVIRCARAALLLGLVFAYGCYGKIEPMPPFASTTPVPSFPWCPEQPLPSAIYQIEEPRPGASYTRHVPIHAFVRAESDGLVDVEVRSSPGGLLAASELALDTIEVNGFYEVKGTIVLQLLSERERACVSLSGRGWTALIPVRVGGANP